MSTDAGLWNRVLPSGWRELPRVVWVLVAARAANRLGAFTLPFLSLVLVREFAVSVAAAGVLITGFGAATIPSRLLGGQLADRIGRKATIVIGLTGCAVAQSMVAATGSLVLVAIAVLILGLSFELYEPPSQAIIADVTAPEHRSAAYGLLGAALAGAAVGAGLLAAWIGQISLRWLFVIDAATCIACALVVLFVLPGTEREATDGQAPVPARPWRDLGLMAMLAAATVFAVIYYLITFGVPLTLIERGLPAEQFGLLLALGAVTIVLGQPLLATNKMERLNDFTALSIGYALLGTGLLGYALATNFTGFVVATVVQSIGDLILLGRAYSVVAALAPEHARGRYLAVFGTSWGAAAVIAPLGGMQLLDSTNGFVFWVTCASACAVLAVAQPFLRRCLERKQKLSTLR
ncbi:MFS transporter [Umezawaea sp. NPDC059074]|uniref:MFS transporter n=1 Tax=Umezawaea sp. NPDC059074 TaxID=3346716 RepID=UPI003687E8CC